ncbi:SDR family oxidoreductase [Rudaeicoccus suwonensis]|uniref:NADP-dependent 3-hydroxy acid dehydrogenase YdfG n=1 Tax=Rudaeicoccus suwonensis TaxID=657409 RepID=A0A561E7K0_9MICO|nr:SDR family oxidoreductase [Rudaeicoccus suwonensis]TWE11589.1 NADP-dependent 3-hydroxy acid dehydrogenase YdfG [Rudaeicoccus suwonensis]
MADWQDKGVVVTGAARGIGRAIATRLRDEGARVVIADVLEEPLRETAESIGAHAVSGDCASAGGVQHLITQATAQLGEIDVWVGNAGIARGEGLASTEAEWAASWEVNVMAHVRAAQLLIPGWLERGHGRFVVTASAAGLLTILGQPTYAVTKHGAEAFAEWLAASYGHRGIKVHAICPQGVRTDMYPGPGDGALAEVIGHDGALQPEDVATALVETIEREEFLVLPHPEVRDYFGFRGANTDKWLSGMQRLQGRIDELDQPR